MPEGKPKPNMVAVAAAVGAIAIMLGALYGYMFSRLLPSAYTQGTAMGAGLICAFVGLIWANHPNGFHPASEFYAERPMPKWLRNAVVRSIVTAALCGGTAHTAFLTGFPSLYSEQFGSPEEEVVTVSGTRWRTRYNCGHFVVREYPDAPGRALCAASEDLTAVPVGARLLISGRKSAFGLEVESLRLL